MESEYLQRLLEEHNDVGERYRIKLKLIGGIHPFALNLQLDLNYAIDGVPPITNMDIVTYLVLSTSFYTKEQMKAFKSLQAYKFFESGFVVKIGTKILKDLYVLVGKVKHSQKANLKPVDVWCIVAKDGSVCTAHCTCMTGNSEVCSHVGAILFSAEFANSQKQAMSCTDTQAMWPMPSSSAQVPIVSIRKMDWGKATTSSQKVVKNISSEELNGILNKIAKLGQSCALMRIVEPFASEIADEASKPLPLMFNVFKETNVGKTYMELMQQGRDVDFSINREQVTMIEEATTGQAASHNWFLQRAGRITASKFKSVCKTNKAKPSLSLIKSICYPNKMINTKATNWGTKNECNAVAAYQKHMAEKKHSSFIVNEVGLIVSTTWPQLAASPDRLVFCECCFGGCLEVKCPYLLPLNNIQSIQEYVKMKNSCLVVNGGKITLNTNHSYYYQVQMQIFVSNLNYCGDFVIWSPSIFFKIRILPDFEFWETESKIALKFHAEVIMPELLGKYFSLKSGAAEVTHWCICNGVDDGRPMIRCEEDDCKVQWFHFDCIGLLNTPDCFWYCSECKFK